MCSLWRWTSQLSARKASNPPGWRYISSRAEACNTSCEYLIIQGKGGSWEQLFFLFFLCSRGLCFKLQLRLHSRSCSAVNIFDNHICAVVGYRKALSAGQLVYSHTRFFAKAFCPAPFGTPCNAQLCIAVRFIMCFLQLSLSLSFCVMAIVSL